MSVTATTKATALGTLSDGVLAQVDGRGTLVLDDAVISWWIDAGPRDEGRSLHDARAATAVRQRALDDVPVVETAMRVGSGDVLARAYAVGGEDPVVVVEVENTTRVPGALGLVVEGRDVRLDGSTVLVDGWPRLTVDRAPTDSITVDDACTVVVPIPHGATVRAVTGPAPRVAPPAADDVVRAWRAQLARGLEVQVPDARWQSAIERARAQVLLLGTELKPDGAVVAALEDWGFDDEAEAAWDRIGFGGRRAASRRPTGSAAELWARADALATAADAGPLPDPAALLLAVRAVLVRDGGDEVALLETLPDVWVGAPIDVRHAPTRSGVVSYTVRWHGPRPALLWECDRRVALRAPGLDPSWSTVEPRGEALLRR